MSPKRTPIWDSIRAALTADIAEGRYRPGDKLPTEAELAQRFGVNRHTVRRALGAMAGQALIHTRRGAGAFVAQTPTDYPLGRRVRFHQSLQAAGRLPTREFLSMETRPADAREAEALNLSAGARVHVQSGLSLADGQPMSLFQSTFPAERFPDMLAALERLRSVTAAFAEHGITDYTRAWTRLNAKLANATQALHLRLNEGDPILRTISVNVDPEGRAIEYGRAWFAGDRVTLTLSD